MKKLVAVIFTTMMIISMVACDSNPKQKIDTPENITIEEHNKIVDELETKINNNIDKAIELPDLRSEANLMGELYYNADRDIYAYIDELGFEVVGNVNLFNPNTGEITKLTAYDYDGKQQTVKKLAWYSENQLLAIIGFSTGTVTVGGRVYLLNIDTKELRLLMDTNIQEEILDIVIPDGGSGHVIFPVAVWDAEVMYFDTYSRLYNYEEFQSLVDSPSAHIISRKSEDMAEETSNVDNSELLFDQWNNLWYTIYNTDGEVSDSLIDEINMLLKPELSNKDMIEMNPLSCFFTSFYDDVSDIDIKEFLMCFPREEHIVTSEEFEELKTLDNWPFVDTKSFEDMPVPIHRYSNSSVELIFNNYAGRNNRDLSWVGNDYVYYLDSTNSYYNYTSDYGPGVFICSEVVIEDDTIILIGESNRGISTMLTIVKNSEIFHIKSYEKR